jgi:hypothetical protein
MWHIIVTTTLGAMASLIGGINVAAAADILSPPPQVQVQPPPPDYYANPPPEAPYAYPPPGAYRYPPPPPPPVSYYYEESAPPIVIAPRPYYFGRHYGPLYEDHPYAMRGFGPYVARGYGHYDHRWDHDDPHWDRAYRGW